MTLLDPPRRRPRPEPVVPMINVVFLLLIFFLMTASLTTPAPFPLTPVTAEGTAADQASTLYLSGSGDVAFGAFRGPEALREAARTAPLRLAADANLPAAELAIVLRRLAALGATQVELVTSGGP